MSSASAYRLGLLLAGLHFTHHLVSANIVLIHSGTALVVVFPMRTKKVFITSPGHEGSHALCESFQYYLAKVECNEIFDPDPNDEDKVKVNELHSFGGVALLRVRANHMKQFSADDKFVMIVRTDLMRWALSNYFKQNYAILGRHHDASPLNDTLVYKDPQFTPNVTLPVRKIDLSLLVRITRSLALFVIPSTSLPRPQNRNTKRLIEAWYAKLKVLNWLKQNNRTFVIATYEQFLMSGVKYTGAIMKAIGELSPPGFSPPAAVQGNVSRVHSDDLHEYAANIDEVVRFFVVTPFMTWSMCCGQYHSNVHVSADDPSIDQARHV